MHPPPPFCWEGGGVEPPTKFSKMRGLVGPPFLEWCCWERGGDFFQGGLQFFNNKVNSGMFNDKKFIKKNALS